MLAQLSRYLNILFLISITQGEALYSFNSPAKEQHYYQYINQIRCLVCQNESIKDSNAPLANQLRSVIYEQMAQGKDDAEITFFLRSRYGEFINYAPKFSWETCLLWLLPLTTLAWAALYLFCKKKKPCL